MGKMPIMSPAYNEATEHDRIEYSPDEQTLCFHGPRYRTSLDERGGNISMQTYAAIGHSKAVGCGLRINNKPKPNFLTRNTIQPSSLYVNGSGLSV